MEGDMKSPLQFEDAVNADDSKYLCGLSTILVATIQELKDRISQIEFIFCSQLFPNFQSRSKLVEKRLLEARKAAEDEWKKEESSLLSQIKEFHLEKQQSQEQIHQLNLSLEQSKARLASAEQMLQSHEYEKKQLVDRLENLQKREELIAELKEQLGQKISELAEERELQKRLFQQIEVKDRQISVEQSKQKSLQKEYSTRYKELKSQYNFLLRRTGLITEDKPHLDRIEDQEDLSRPPCIHKSNLQNLEEKDQENTFHATKPSPWQMGKKFQEKLQGDQGIGLVKSSNSHASYSLLSNSTSLPQERNANKTKPEPLDGKKKAMSSWRNTRMRQEPDGADPHDDFLDTPMEIVRHVNKVPVPEEVQDIPVPVPRDMDFNNSDDETQEIDPKTLPQEQHVAVLKPENKGFKYVEPVRKRAERENLTGIECKQCKKFYDAVLPGDGGKGDHNTNSHNNVRCEHHDGVSRHRYRYLPPMTPEGFWNIGFDSER